MGMGRQRRPYYKIPVIVGTDQRVEALCLALCVSWCDMQRGYAKKLLSKGKDVNPSFTNEETEAQEWK